MNCPYRLTDLMNILIVKMSAVGDVIHTLPAVNALRDHFPGARITWLVEEAASDIVRSHKAVDHVLISKRKKWLKGLLGSERLESVKGIFSFTRELRDTEYDLVIDFQGLLKSAVMVALSRGKRKLGYDKTREFSYIVLNDRVPAFDMDKHAIFRYLNLIKHVGVNCENIRFDVPFGEKERSEMSSILRRGGWNSEPLVSVSPMAKWNTKLWETGKFSTLADKLIEETGCFVVFTGDVADREEIKKIVSGMQRKCLDISGRTDLKHLAALYEMSQCVLSTDSGAMHLAAAAGSPVVALFGPTAPWRTGPFGEGHEVLRAGLPCSPCFKKKCDTVACMRRISVEQVLAAIRRTLKRSSGA